MIGHAILFGKWKAKAQRELLYETQCVVLKGAMRNYTSGQLSTCLEHQQSRGPKPNIYIFKLIFDISGKSLKLSL